ncbi:MAG: flagellar export chaperone FliS [Spirochaetes bacterium]|nr:flagellar export chaperone FliS [Spirochaetota bacterium]
MNKGIEHYKKTDVNTSSQGKLVVMLYDGAIKFLETALAAVGDKHKIDTVHNNIVKAQDIIVELLASLNYDAGDIANRLAAIYTYMNKRLLEANVKKEREPIVEVIGYMKELKDAWSKAAESVSVPERPATPALSAGKVNITG